MGITLSWSIATTKCIWCIWRVGHVAKIPVTSTFTVKGSFDKTKVAVGDKVLFSNGTTTTVPESQLRVEQGEGRMFQWPAGARLQSIIDTVNSTGATPDDIMAILQALDQAGAIDGELVVI